MQVLVLQEKVDDPGKSSEKMACLAVRSLRSGLWQATKFGDAKGRGNGKLVP